MVATDQSDPKKIVLTTDRLLLVEGQDEVNLLGALIKTCLQDDGQRIQILAVGGKDKFRPQPNGDKGGRPIPPDSPINRDRPGCG